MTALRRSRRAAVATLAAALVLAGALPAVANTGDETADGYPTWDEVNAARASQSAKQAEYAKLQQALQRAQSGAATASTKAVAAFRTAQRADQDLADATAREKQLQSRLKADRTRLQSDSESLGRVVSWMYRDGTGLASTSQLITAKDPAEFMSKLDTAQQVAGTWNTLSERAAAAVNTEQNLKDQATSAKKERARLAAEADRASTAASTAQERADAAVDTASRSTGTVYAQLASLRGTTAKVEERYQLGLQVAEQQREEEARRQQQEQNGGNGGGNGGGGNVNIGGGVTVDPAGAQAYARSVLPSYGWGGEQFSCLVSLWNGESDWRADALNPSSGAYGIPQALPAEKMAAAGADWRTNGATQVNWGLAYISASYGSPCNAWNTWQSRSPHWY
ncbi:MULTISPECIES: coiled-coil domain-containing protein [unclassified Leucobacter]|uniref:coiled-coil domain-containing protein n=1 Tax=unclassified Leucobacter TaxID=2621730 RepID=UPI0006224D93|nr:hypothetical protein [Leucobacter sp. Ag1]KKI22718.1 hypothetical protein XM48_00470 [Leucobacter sp. Ag1]